MLPDKFKEIPNQFPGVRNKFRIVPDKFQEVRNKLKVTWRNSWQCGKNYFF